MRVCRILKDYKIEGVSLFGFKVNCLVIMIDIVVLVEE